VKGKDPIGTHKTLIPLKGVLKLDGRENPKSNPKKIKAHIYGVEPEHLLTGKINDEKLEIQLK
jgi:hypothetical protein